MKTRIRARKASQTPEGNIQRAIMQYLRYRKVACWRINVIGIPMGDGKYRPNPEMVGVADIHCIIPVKGIGASVHLEVKAPKKKQTEHQLEFQRKVETAGGYYFVVRSVEDVQQVLEKLTTVKSSPE